MTREAETAFGSEPRSEVSRLNRAGRRTEAVQVADKLLAQISDPHDILGVQMSKLSALLNLERDVESAAVIGEAGELIARHPDLPAADIAEFHAVVAFLEYRGGDYDACVTSLVRGARALESVVGDDTAVRPWLAMATTYSYLGFHSHAAAAQQRAADLSVNPDQRKLVRHPEIRIRHATFLDQTGATAAAMDVFADLVHTVAPDDLVTMEIPWLGYARARYAALGGLCDTRDAPRLLGLEPEPAELREELMRLGSAALAIADRRIEEALDLLSDATVEHTRLGAAEVPRLRALAYAAAGEHAAAHEADREATFLVAGAADPLYGLLVNGITARLHIDELQRDAQRYADQAQTDPLTGLPNRRRLEQYVDELTRRGDGGVLGVADLDRFKEVNTVHGHLVGDQVLEQAATVLTGALRAGDFLARYGGDEFVIVLPGATMRTARDLQDRLVAAVSGHDWETVAPGTPVSVTMGLAEVGNGVGLTEAFQAADLLMLQAKARR